MKTTKLYDARFAVGVIVELLKIEGPCSRAYIRRELIATVPCFNTAEAKQSLDRLLRGTREAGLTTMKNDGDCEWWDIVRTTPAPSSMECWCGATSVTDPARWGDVHPCCNLIVKGTRAEERAWSKS